jgi:hypothetical protein
MRVRRFRAPRLGRAFAEPECRDCLGVLRTALSRHFGSPVDRDVAWTAIERLQEAELVMRSIGTLGAVLLRNTPDVLSEKPEILAPLQAAAAHAPIYFGSITTCTALRFAIGTRCTLPPGQRISI